MLLLLERKNKFWCVWCCRASLNIWPEVFCQKKGRPLTTFSFIPTLFWAHTQFQLIFCSFFFILGLGWVVVWCRHELVFVVDQSSHLCNPCSPSEEAESEGKNWKLKNIFQKLKNLFFSKTSDLQSWPRKVDAMQPRRRREQPPDVLAADPAVDPLSKILLG